MMDALREAKGVSRRAVLRVLGLVGLTFFFLGAYIAVEAISTLATASVPDTSTVGLILSDLCVWLGTFGWVVAYDARLWPAVRTRQR